MPFNVILSILMNFTPFNVTQYKSRFYLKNQACVNSSKKNHMPCKIFHQAKILLFQTSYVNCAVF